VLGFGALLVLEIKSRRHDDCRLDPGGPRAGAGAAGDWRGKSWSSTRSAYERLSKLLSENPAREAGMALPADRHGVGGRRPRWRRQQEHGAERRQFRHRRRRRAGHVGPSGCGKSTLARLLVGVWPAGGQVRLDGADIYQWNKDQLGPHLGYLPQDIELFAGSIRKHRPLRRGGRRASGAGGQARRRARPDPAPKGYDTLLGDGGAGLSGGQKQRLGLARAMYGDPSLLVLDEPNSTWTMWAKQRWCARSMTCARQDHRADHPPHQRDCRHQSCW
jgi:ATP-binding cassette subfamily C exporter for protease/lipase